MARASLWLAFAIAFVGLGVSASYPHPWIPPESTAIITATCFVMAAICGIRSHAYYRRARAGGDASAAATVVAAVLAPSGDPYQPFTLTKSGADAAHNIRLSPLVIGSDVVEFYPPKQLDTNTPVLIGIRSINGVAGARKSFGHFLRDAWRDELARRRRQHGKATAPDGTILFDTFDLSSDNNCESPITLSYEIAGGAEERRYRVTYHEKSCTFDVALITPTEIENKLVQFVARADWLRYDVRDTATFDRWKREFADWLSGVNHYLASNVSPRAALTFRDISATTAAAFIDRSTFNAEHATLRADLTRYETNLKQLIGGVRSSEAKPLANNARDTAQERYYNLKLQAEGPELANKIIRGSATDRPIMLAGQSEPDVLLELSGGPVVTRHTASSLESVDFVVYNDSADATAMHVQIAELSSGDYHDGGYWTGDAATPAGAATANTKLKFALVPHIEGKRRIEVEPINPGFSMPDRIMQEIGKMPANQRAQDVSVGLWWFIDAARKARILKAPEPASESERRNVSQKLDEEPIGIPMRVIYSNVQATQSWERQEVLHYDPRTRAAYVSHGQRQEITGRIDPPTQASQPVITLRVIHSQDHAEVVVRNGGGDAEVWGVLQLTGAVPAPFHDLWCRWDVLSSRAKIAHGEERRAVLANRVHDTKGGNSDKPLRWHIYCYGGGPLTLVSDELNPQPSIDPTGDIVIEGAILSDPESANGTQSFRVTLKPSGALVNSCDTETT